MYSPKMSKYTPVHPLLAELDAEGWYFSRATTVWSDLCISLPFSENKSNGCEQLGDAMAGFGSMYDGQRPNWLLKTNRKI